MHFGPRSEKYNQDIQQLELRLEDLESSQAAAEPPPTVPATVALRQQAPRKPARRPLPAELPRETETIAPAQEACPDCGGTLRRLGEDVTETLELKIKIGPGAPSVCIPATRTEQTLRRSEALDCG
jgi:transposase